MAVLSKILHDLANRVDANECTPQDWLAVTAAVNALTTASTSEEVEELKQDLQDLKSNIGYISKHVESLENAPQRSQTIIRKLHP